jgi:hypothetical protein
LAQRKRELGVKKLSRLIKFKGKTQGARYRVQEANGINKGLTCKDQNSRFNHLVFDPWLLPFDT